MTKISVEDAQRLNFAWRDWEDFTRLNTWKEFAEKYPQYAEKLLKAAGEVEDARQRVFDVIYDIPVAKEDTDHA